MADEHPPPEEYVERLRQIVGGLPEIREEDAWRGVRWRVGTTTVAHTLVVLGGTPPSYARATGLDGPATVLTFHAAGDELVFYAEAGLPYFSPPWSPTTVGMVIDDGTDWSEVGEAVTESYRICAPAPRSTRPWSAGLRARGATCPSRDRPAHWSTRRWRRCTGRPLGVESYEG